MTTKEDLLTWHQGVVHFENRRYKEAISALTSVSAFLGAKIHFNIGICYTHLKQHKEAIASYSSAVKADSYFAAAYFMRAYHHSELRSYNDALADLDETVNHLRGNLLIDYEQLGMDFKLFLCEVLYNRAACLSLAGQRDAAQDDLAHAIECKMESSHDSIDKALRSLKFGAMYVVPPGCLYRPSETKVKNVEKVNYLGQSKVIAQVDDVVSGFQGAVLRRQQAEREAAAAAAPSRPTGRAGMPAPPPPARPQPGVPVAKEGRGTRPPPPRGEQGPVPLAPGRPGVTQRPPPNFAPAAAASPSSSALGSVAAGKVKVKCYAKDTRYVLIDRTATYAEFAKKVKEKFDGQTLKLAYKDADGDKVSLTDDEDLAMAMEEAGAEGKLELWCR